MKKFFVYCLLIGTLFLFSGCALGQFTGGNNQGQDHGQNQNDGNNNNSGNNGNTSNNGNNGGGNNNGGKSNNGGNSDNNGDNSNTGGNNGSGGNNNGNNNGGSSDPGNTTIMSFQPNQPIPDYFPKDIPILDGANINYTFYTKDDSGTLIMLTYEIPTPYDDVVSFYKNHINNNGYSNTYNMTTDTAYTTGGSKDNFDLFLSASKSIDDENITVVSISISYGY